MSDNELDTTVDDWRAEMERLAPISELESLPYLSNGKTTTELMELFQLSQTAVLIRIRKLLKTNRCIKGKAKRKSINGQMKFVPVYQLIKEKQ